MRDIKQRVPADRTRERVEEQEPCLVQLGITARLLSGAQHRFGPILLGKQYGQVSGGIRMMVDPDAPYGVSLTPPVGDVLTWIEYRIRGPLKNLDRVIGPGGRLRLFNEENLTAPVAWQNGAVSRIGDVRMPLYLFTGRGGGVELALGIVGDLIETDFRLIEPKFDRVRVEHTGFVEVAIRIGSDAYPLRDDGGAHIDHVYVHLPAGRPPQPWLTVVREFTQHVHAVYDLPVPSVAASLEPFWSSWSGSATSQVDEAIVLSNAQIGVDMGVRNFVIDDGWYGPGLDSPSDMPVNIGDWDPDRTKYPDMRRLVSQVNALGGRAIIWCVPHAVGPAAQSFSALRQFLIADHTGLPTLGDAHFFSLCFMNAQAREVMIDICDRLEREWGFAGAKYDLFSRIPKIRCASPHHLHDIDSNLAGFGQVLAAAGRRIRRRRPNYIVELEQSCGTAFLARYATCVQADGVLFGTRESLLRSLHVQSYTPYALNRYHMIARSDTTTDVAVSVIKMMAAGIPAYGGDLAGIGRPQQDVIRWYHDVYCRHRNAFTNSRVTEDLDLAVMRAEARDGDLMFVVGRGAICLVRRPTIVCNGTYDGHLIFQVAPELEGLDLHLVTRDAEGREVASRPTASAGWRDGGGPRLLPVPPGGSVVIGSMPMPEVPIKEQR
ncbi:alpha-galactosidase [Actinoplanes sp. CA-030573]|uniref:alpha-galactosidase n=1 Tax=Actinoplanes sp. CA-030573 TaxID=3239898 RepID=UPI003D8F7847